MIVLTQTRCTPKATGGYPALNPGRGGPPELEVDGGNPRPRRATADQPGRDPRTTAAARSHGAAGRGPGTGNLRWCWGTVYEVGIGARTVIAVRATGSPLSAEPSTMRSAPRSSTTTPPIP